MRASRLVAFAAVTSLARVAFADPPAPSPAAEAAPSAPSAPRVAFDEAVRRAMSTHPTVAQGRAQIARAEALASQARALLYPTVTVNATYTRLDADRTLGDRVILGANQLSANAVLSVPLYNPRSWSGLSRANDNTEVARAGAADARRQVAIATARAWLAVSSQHRMIATSERALAASEAHRAFSEERLSGGIGTRLDVVRWGQESATVRMTLAGQRAGLSRLQEALGVLVGEDGPLDAVDDIAPGRIPERAAGLAEVTGRSDVSAQASRLSAARRSADASWSDWLPSLTAVFQPFYQNPPSLTQPLVGWQAQVVFSWPVFDGGIRSAVARERRAQLEEARAAYDGAVRQARSEVRAALVAIGEADSRAAAAREAAALAAEAASLAEESLRAGATNSLELVDAERRARDARAAANMAEDDAREARLNLLIAAGRFPR